MKRRLRHLQNQPVTLAEMGPALIRIWNNITQAFIHTLIRSMCRRYEVCIDANGGHTLLILLMSKSLLLNQLPLFA